jgi:hypothetical protein
MTLVLDSGALIALERNDRPTWRRLRQCLASGGIPVTHGGVLGQAWRGSGPRQALLALALDYVQVLPLDEPLGRRAGELLAQSRTADVIDAALVLLSDDGDEILTSDEDDLRMLVEHADRHVDLIPV